MRVHVRAFCAAAVDAFTPADPVFEFGALRVDERSSSANLRPLFPGAHYVGCDLRPGPGVDRVEDVSATTFESESAGTVVCLDTLEHVFRVHSAFDEMFRILRPAGLLIVATPLRFPIHEHPDDYWRITPHCLARLTSSFGFRVIGSQGTDTFPHTVYAVAIKDPIPANASTRATRFIEDYSKWLENTQAELPITHKLKRLLKRVYRSKGERRELQHEHTVRFAILHGHA